MPKLERLTEELNNKINSENASGSYYNGAYDEKNILRRKAEAGEQSIWHTPFVSNPLYVSINTKADSYPLLD